MMAMSVTDSRKIALKYANIVRHMMHDKRSVDAIDTAKKYAAGEATNEQVEIARIGACDAMCNVPTLSEECRAASAAYDAIAAHAVVDNGSFESVAVANSHANCAKMHATRALSIDRGVSYTEARDEIKKLMLRDEVE